MELYIHIPFCIRKCAYCDFLSGPADEQTQDRYMVALLREVELAGEMHRNHLRSKADLESSGHGNTSQEETVETIFIGGGTPSAVDAEWILRLMEQVKTSFVVAEDAEITMEANPGTLTREKLAMYRQAGINRLSMGLQSTDNGELARLGRIHTYEAFLENYRMARQAGFTNINIDLMSALPGQSIDSYEETLRRVIALEPEHISAYSLIIEEGTPFGERYPERLDGTEEGSAGSVVGRESQWQLPTEEEDRQMYHLTKSILAEAGYHRYEISNYSRPGYECRHNVGYWTGVPYLGLGIGAASYYGGARFSNTREMEEYLQILRQEELDADSVWQGLRCDKELLSVQDSMEEFMFLGLRLTGGISESDFEKRFGQTMRSVYGMRLEKLEDQGLLSKKKVLCLADTEDRAETEDTIWTLTELGLDVSNSVFAEFLL